MSQLVSFSETFDQGRSVRNLRRTGISDGKSSEDCDLNRVNILKLTEQQKPGTHGVEPEDPLYRGPES